MLNTTLRDLALRAVPVRDADSLPHEAANDWLAMHITAQPHVPAHADCVRWPAASPMPAPLWAQVRSRTTLRELRIPGVPAVVAQGEMRSALATMSALRVLDVSQSPALRDEALFLSPTLEVLVVTGCGRLGNATVRAALTQCPELRVLEIGHVAFTNDGIMAAVAEAKCTHLLRLGLSKTAKLRDTGVEALARGPFASSLSSLALETCFYLTDKALAAVGQGMLALLHLNVSGCPRITAAGMELLPASLEEVVAEFCDGLSSVSALRGREHVVSLQVAFCHAFTPTALREASLLFPALRRVRLQNASPDLIILDAFLVALATTCGAGLVEVQLHPCALGDEGLSALATRARDSLEILHLAGARLSFGNASLARLAECSRLRSVSFGRLVSDASDVSLLGLAQGLPCLEMLDLNLHTLTGAGLAQAALHLRALKAVSLRHCARITDDAVAALVAHASRLQSLDVGKCTLLTSAAVEAACQRARHLVFLNVAGIPALTAERINHFRARFPSIVIVDQVN